MENLFQTLPHHYVVLT